MELIHSGGKSTVQLVKAKKEKEKRKKTTVSKTELQPHPGSHLCICVYACTVAGQNIHQLGDVKQKPSIFSHFSSPLSAAAAAATH